MTAVSRLGFSSPLLAYVWEFQKRGVLHQHLVSAFSTPEELAASRAYQAELVRLSGVYLFGRVDSEERPRSVERAADYLARYLVRGGRGSKPSIQETVTRPDAPKLVAYVAAWLTVATMITMGYLREKRQAFHHARWLVKHSKEFSIMVLYCESWGFDVLEVIYSANGQRPPPDWHREVRRIGVHFRG